MNINGIKRATAMISLGVFSTVTFVSCGSTEEYGLTVTAIAPEIDYEKAQQYSQSLTAGTEELPVYISTEMITAANREGSSEEAASSADGVSPDAVGEIGSKSAEMMGATSLMKITTQLAANEIDIIICDYDNGQHFAQGGAFMPLSELFSAEELASIDEFTLVSYEQTDEEGNPTGEMMPQSGIDVSHIEELTDFISADRIVCHVVKNTENLEAATEYMLSLVL